MKTTTDMPTEHQHKWILVKEVPQFSMFQSTIWKMLFMCEICGETKKETL